MITICDHARITVYRNKDGEELARLCSDCRLPEGTPPIVCEEGDMEPWWLRDEEIAIRERHDRVGAHVYQEAKVALREHGKQLAEDLHWEMAIFGESTMTEWLMKEIEENERERSDWFR